ncbi:imidazole glycerol phosphate synthase subunit HisH [Isoptericola sp. CG 20/1183]|uniref:Imidazole glycerol phosphate synthase subunit HisH n=1 Tax=Isoptericola halotolerans TaxID=300560 RepID=A0ABX5EDS5_9MICO|nr:MULTISPECIES: imidazole glycerol phosphate synthase subunit HisH [Isoptericola]MCK0116583.1 imidazole glycerol phosphate synthase subunit HisH [Isoptericola sp. S6320L]PRZ05550.1 imidazole glycerol phosphate synthase subunit HisH [Isoptericola halotolerans]PRZ06118.1 imidazole glycerol phosphate synthase subunit HisH [Isoptericola sp. CG 20/1183]
MTPAPGLLPDDGAAAELNARPVAPGGPAARPRVVVLDYGFGNVRSAVRALERVGADVELTADRHAATEADGLVVPGVGAFAACMEGLRAVRGDQVVDRRLAGGRPVLGVCVGMQVMFDAGVEHGVRADGLGEWRGVVDRLEAPVVPHMGWSGVEAATGSTLFAGVEQERFYFVHSYAAQEFTQGHDDSADPRYTPPRVTWSSHGPAGAAARFVAAVEDGPLSATQFHPEKSGDAGATLLENWVRSL